MTPPNPLAKQLRELSDAVWFDEPKLAPTFDWSQEPARVVTDALRQAADALEAAEACIKAVRDFHLNHEILGWGGHEGVAKALDVYDKARSGGVEA